MRTSNRGFTLLEAIVALSILALALMACYGWLANNMHALIRVHDLALEEAALQQAISVLEQSDLASEPAGSLPWRALRIDWQAEPLEQPRRGQSGIGAPGNYELTLFQVELQLFHHDRLIAQPQLRLLQYRALAVRNPPP